MTVQSSLFISFASDTSSTFLSCLIVVVVMSPVPKYHSMKAYRVVQR